MKTQMLEDCMLNENETMYRYHQLTQKKGDCYYFNTYKFLSRLPFIRKKKYRFLGETCSICLENIYTISSGWITSCSHVFHKKCLRQWCIKTNLNGNCPECRGDMGCLEFLDGIRYVTPVQNALDLIEELDNITHHICHDCNGVLGMTSDCDRCNRYLQNGKIY